MYVVQIDACPQNLLELRKRVTSLRTSGLVRCQVAGDDQGIVSRYGTAVGSTEHLSATQIDGRIQHLRLRKVRAKNELVRVVARQEIEVRRLTAVVATVAVAGRVHDVTAETHQSAVLAGEIEGDGCDLESPWMRDSALESSAR